MQSIRSIGCEKFLEKEGQSSRSAVGSDIAENNADSKRMRNKRPFLHKGQREGVSREKRRDTMRVTEIRTERPGEINPWTSTRKNSNILNRLKPLLPRHAERDARPPCAIGLFDLGQTFERIKRKNGKLQKRNGKSRWQRNGRNVQNAYAK
jgi:hypothetical protein